MSLCLFNAPSKSVKDAFLQFRWLYNINHSSNFMEIEFNEIEQEVKQF